MVFSLNFSCYNSIMVKEIRIEVLGKSLYAYKPILAKRGKKLAEILKLKKPIDLFLIDSETMRKLNRKYRKKNKATNVLSFATPLNFPPTAYSLSGPKIYRKRMKTYLYDSTWVYILGYDHIRTRDRIVMERKRPH